MKNVADSLAIIKKNRLTPSLPSIAPTDEATNLFIRTKNRQNIKNQYRHGIFPLVALLLVSFCLHITTLQYALAQSKKTSGLPLPRFVSLKAKRVNMRVGPGRDYQVQWLYVRKTLPMEVIQEFGNWRKVRDPNGNEGWVLHSLLSGRRVTIVTPWDMPTKNDKKELNPASLPTVGMYASPSTGSNVVARIEAGTLADVEECRDEWCKLKVISVTKTEISGYVRQSLLWGVYPDEKVKN